jgi:hypothetical protein
MVGVPAVGGTLLAAALLLQYRFFASLSAWASFSPAVSLPWGAILLLELTGAGTLLLAAANSVFTWESPHPVPPAAFSVVLTNSLCLFLLSAP